MPNSTLVGRDLSEAAELLVMKVANSDSMSTGPSNRMRGDTLYMNDQISPAGHGSRQRAAGHRPAAATAVPGIPQLYP